MLPSAFRIVALSSLSALALVACALPPSPLDAVGPERVQQIESADWIGEALVSSATSEAREGRDWLRLELEVQEAWKGWGRSTQTLLVPVQSSDRTRPERLEGSRLVIFGHASPERRGELLPAGGSTGLYLVRSGERGELVLPVASPRQRGEETLHELREQVIEWVAWNRFQREREIEQTLDVLRTREALGRSPGTTGL